MSSSVISALRTASQQVTIYLNLTNLIGGVLGNSLNILVFLSLKTFRESTCAFYLIIMSFLNIGQLLTGAVSRIVISGFGYDLTTSSAAYCKIRVYLLQFFGLASLTLLCLATIDQYLATCSRPRWQNWSNIKVVRTLSIFTITFWALVSVPYLFMFDVQMPANTSRLACMTTDPHFNRYNVYWQRFTMQGCLPNFLTILFGILTHSNIKSLAYRTVPLVRRESDKQLSNMLLVQVTFNIFALLFFNIMSIVAPLVHALQNGTSSAIVQFFEILSYCFYYMYFACPFYIYICVSERFRRQLLHAFFTRHRDWCQKRRIGATDDIALENIARRSV